MIEKYAGTLTGMFARKVLQQGRDNRNLRLEIKILREYEAAKHQWNMLHYSATKAEFDKVRLRWKAAETVRAEFEKAEASK